MSTTQVTAPPTGQLQTIALSQIVAIDGWNPRQAMDDAELHALATSMRERGCLQPIRVQLTGDGRYRVIAGERRYKAAVLAQLTELPAIVRVADAEETPEVRDAELLVDALVENQLRAPLSPVEEALACRRLKTDHGLTVKGIAEKLQMKQARVRERLAILELPEELWPHVGSGEIPANAVGALVALGKIHAGLPEVAVTLVLDCGDVYDTEPWAWRDVADDALGMVANGLHDETVTAPAGVFVSTHRHPLNAFTLDDKHQADAAKLAELQGALVEDLAIRFDRDAIEQARKLGAAHAPEHGWATLIVGQDVADQLAGDEVTAALKTARAKRRHEASRPAAASSAGATAGGETVDEEAQREQARAERAAAAAERERAAAFNDELGAAIVNALSRVKVDERTVKILTAINIAAELDRIAMRGARYGFPGWVTIEDGKRATKRRYLEQRSDAEAKAIEYLAGAKTAGEVAGRTLALLLMAIYAREDAVANSNRAFHTVTVTTALPWAGEVPELIDELAGEKLPAALMDPILEERRARHAERRAAAAAKAQAQTRVAELEPRMGQLRAAELDELEPLIAVAHGEYSAAAWALRDKLRARRGALTDADAGTEAQVEPDASVDPAQANAPSEPDEPVDVVDEPAHAAHTAAE
jgi:ParB/RepB/Spo0J family partition protein